MKFTLPTLLSLALLAGLVYQPRPAFAQSKEILATNAVQREVYDLQRVVNELKTAQDTRIGQLETLLKQALEANMKLASEQQDLLDMMKSNQLELQRRAYDPLAAVKIATEDSSAQIAALQASVETMRKREESMEKLLGDVSSGVKLLASAPPPPAPTPVSSAPAAPSNADAAKILFASAQTDRLKGDLNSALAQFGDIAQRYPDMPEAPMSVLEVGHIYAANEDYEQAVLAYDRVLEQFGDNPMRKDAQFGKAQMLEALDKRTEAAREYETFAKQYPTDPNGPRAAAKVRELRNPPPSASKPKPAASKPKGKR